MVHDLSRIDLTEIEGFILAGGRSSRFGSDKALALLEGRPLLEWAVRALEELGVDARVVAPDPSPYLPAARPSVSTETPGLGPVEGLRAALQACERAYALVLAADMPWVNAASLQPLVAAAHGGAEPDAVCYADARGRRHPFPGMYRRPVLDAIGRRGTGESMQGLLDSIETRLLRQADVGPGVNLGQVLRNVNRPEDLL